MYLVPDSYNLFDAMNRILAFWPRFLEEHFSLGENPIDKLDDGEEKHSGEEEEMVDVEKGWFYEEHDEGGNMGTVSNL